jgi:hypothetical protein
MEGLYIGANRLAVLSSGTETRVVPRLQGVVDPSTMGKNFEQGISTDSTPNKSPFLALGIARKKYNDMVTFYVYFPVSDVATTYTITVNGTDYDREVSDHASGILEAFYTYFTTEFDETDSTITKVTLPDNTEALEFNMPNADFTSADIYVTGGAGTIAGYCDSEVISFQVLYKFRNVPTLFEGMWHYINIQNTTDLEANITEVFRCGQYSEVYACITGLTIYTGFTTFVPVAHVTYSFGAVS